MHDHYRMLFESSPDAMLVTDSSGRIVAANREAGALLGYSPDELVGRSQSDFVPPSEWHDVDARLALLRAGRTVRTERLLRRQDNAAVFVEISARMLPDGRNQLVMRDVSARVAAEAQRDRLADALEQAGESIVLTDAQGRVVYVNPAFTRLHGYELADMVGRPTGELLKSGEHSPEFYADVEASLASGFAWSGRIVNRRRDGGRVELDLRISPRRDDSGALIGWTEVGRDITSEVALEAQLHQAVKMEAIGRLAGGMAHDFNNLLTAIRGFAELHLDCHDPSDENRSDIVEILSAADRASSLVRRLLAFSRRTDSHPLPVDVADVVAGTETLVRRLLGEDINVRLRIEPIPAILADPGQIEEILLNFAANSRDAMPDGGSFTVSVVAVRLEEGFVATHTGARAGRYVMLGVSDTGMGMDEETTAHIFEPFFTTKAPGKGTGLGLASVYGIVKQADGYIELDSAPGAGCTFRIYWPAIEQTAVPMVHDKQPQCQHEGGHERILLVEDDPSVRSFAQFALERHGYHVVAFAEPSAALQSALESPTTYDGLVTDVVMPSMSGLVLAARLRAQRPDLPVLYVSGHQGDAAPEPPASGAGRSGPTLAKPFGSCELALALGALFGPKVDDL